MPVVCRCVWWGGGHLTVKKGGVKGGSGARRRASFYDVVVVVVSKCFVFCVVVVVSPSCVNCVERRQSVFFCNPKLVCKKKDGFFNDRTMIIVDENDTTKTVHKSGREVYNALLSRRDFCLH